MNYITLLMSVAISMPTAINVTSERAGNVFTDDEPVQFRVVTSANASLHVTDYEENKVFEKKLSAGEASVDMGKLSRSHYTITVSSKDESVIIYFGVVPSMKDRPGVEDSGIATDSAMSWLVKPEHFDELARLTELSGLTWVRDRISWGEMETGRGKWVEKTRYDLAADIQTKHGLKVYQVFHATPGWAQESKSHLFFPDDLRDVYDFAAEMARRFKGKVLAWEVWNEPDIIQFSDELGDSYSALLKAMYLGFKSADPELLVLLCSFAMPPGKFAETIFQNDVGNYFDIYNYHIYGEWKNHTDRALKHIELMRRYGLNHKPIWLTEAGRPIKREPDLLEFNVEQGRDMANFLPKAIISSLSAGVDKYFWFILPYFRENDVMLFGLLHNDMTPTPGYCALSAITCALGRAKYLGRLEIPGVYAYMFERTNDESAVAFWTDDAEKAFRLHIGADKAKIASLMGTEQEIEARDGVIKLNASTSVNYMILPANAIKDKLKIDHPREKPEIKPSDVSKVLLRLQFPKENRDKKSETYILRGSSPVRVQVEVYNLNRNVFNGKLEVQLPQGWVGALNLSDLTVGPMGKAVRDLQLSPTAAVGSDRVQMRINLINQSGKAETFIIAWVTRG